MFHRSLPKTCSNCGSTRNEEFYSRTKSGTRCLQCGHEKIVQSQPENNRSTAWTHDATKPQTF